MTTTTGRSPIRVLAGDEVRDRASALAELLLDAVADGASVGFLADVTPTQAVAYWRAAAAPEKQQRVIVAEDGAGLAGAVILAPATGAFQPHRAEILKLIVHRRARGQGLAQALMEAAEAEALALGRWQLTLMTRDGSSAARLYARLGWTRAGVLPDDSIRPEGGLCDAAIYFKRLRRPGAEIA